MFLVSLVSLASRERGSELDLKCIKGETSSRNSIFVSGGVLVFFLVDRAFSLVRCGWLGGAVIRYSLWLRLSD